MSDCIHGVDLTKEYCDQGQCHTWTKKNRPDLLPIPWKRLADVKPAEGQLVEYYANNFRLGQRKPDKSYTVIDGIPRKGRFVKDCGTHWTENLNGFTTDVLGVICAPDPEITFWRAVIDWDKDTAIGSNHCLPIPAMPSFSFGDDDDHSPLKLMSANTGISIAEPNYTIIEEGKEVGKIWWDEELSLLRFQGQVDKSVWVLMKELQRRFDDWYEEKYG